MTTKKTKNRNIQIPKPMKIEVDKIVKAGLYSNYVEFVNDAVRRLIIKNKTEENIRMLDKNNFAKNENGPRGEKELDLINKPP